MGGDAQGRPKGGPEDKYRLTPVVPRLKELLGKEVRICFAGNAPHQERIARPLQISTDWGAYLRTLCVCVCV